jgi:hypothetical protein
MNREAQRQQLLMAALWRDQALPEGWLCPPAVASTDHALAAYRSNATATAERTLGAAFPTVAALARHFWHTHPAQCGDLGEWGAGLPDFVGSSHQLSELPYLADCAQLDWAVHQAARAADSPADVSTITSAVLDALAQSDPGQLRLRLADGLSLLCSDFPVVTLWQAHQGVLPFEAARLALEAQQAENAIVFRDAQYRVQVQALADADAAFMQAILRSQTLSLALDAAGPEFAFDQWLLNALAAPWMWAPQHPLPAG